MIEVKKTYSITYVKQGYEHVTAILADSYGNAEVRFTENFKDAYIKSITFAGPVCV